MLGGFRHVKNLDGTKTPSKLLGAYGRWEDENFFEQGNISDFNVPFDSKEPAELTNGNVGSELSSKYDSSAIREYSVTTAHWTRILRIDVNLLGSLKEVKIEGIPVPEFFADKELAIIVGIAWGEGTYRKLTETDILGKADLHDPTKQGQLAFEGSTSKGTQTSYEGTLVLGIGLLEYRKNRLTKVIRTRFQSTKEGVEEEEETEIVVTYPKDVLTE